MSLRTFVSSHSLLYKHPFLAPQLSVLWPFISTFAMSYRPNYQGGRLGGSSGGGRGGGRRGGGGGGGGRGGGGRGEQRWWDPVWRAERLRQKGAEVLVISFLIIFPSRVGWWPRKVMFCYWVAEGKERRIIRLSSLVNWANCCIRFG